MSIVAMTGDTASSSAIWNGQIFLRVFLATSFISFHLVLQKCKEMPKGNIYFEVFKDLEKCAKHWFSSIHESLSIVRASSSNSSLTTIPLNSVGPSQINSKSLILSVLSSICFVSTFWQSLLSLQNHHWLVQCLDSWSKEDMEALKWKCFGLLYNNLPRNDQISLYWRRLTVWGPPFPPSCSFDFEAIKKFRIFYYVTIALLLHFETL